MAKDSPTRTQADLERVMGFLRSFLGLFFEFETEKRHLKSEEPEHESTSKDKVTRKTSPAQGCLALLVGLAIVLGVGYLVTSTCGTSGIPYVKHNGERVNLINNENSEDPSWERLEAFLLQDNTDEHFYMDPFYTCGDFAEDLHNKAEAYGIKCAFVVVGFYSGQPHALNAFKTSDKGLVYIDVTNNQVLDLEALFGTAEFSLPALSDRTDERRLSDPDIKDKVAYIEIGKELGFISLQLANGNLAYENYQQEQSKIDDRVSSLAVKVDEYNAQVEEYNAWVKENALYYLLGTPVLNEQDYQEAMVWKARVEEEWVAVEEEWKNVAGFLWEPMGKVESIEVYW